MAEDLSLEPITTALDMVLAVASPEAAPKGLSLGALSRRFKVPRKKMRTWVDLLARRGAVTLRRSALGTRVSSTDSTQIKGLTVNPDPDAIESYALKAHGVLAITSITEPTVKKRTRYLLRAAPLGRGTLALVEEGVTLFSARAPLPAVPREAGQGKVKEDRAIIKEVLQELLDNLGDDQVESLVGHVYLRSRGLLDLDLYLADDWIEELAINGSKQPMAVYHRRYGWLETERHFSSEEEIHTIASAVTRQAGREITLKRPLIDAPLKSGDRSISTLYPISTHGNTMTIRRFARNPWTMVRLIAEGAISSELAALLWQAVQYEINVIVAGSTASGKTSALNALAGFFPETQRIVSIEDTREIALPSSVEWNWVPLAVRGENPEGEGEISMLELLASALRMRPDRMVVGEVRRREQVLALFEAMNTGHAVYSTIHADSAQQLQRRLLKPPLAIPPGEVQALQLVVVQHRDRRTGRRRTQEIVEVLRMPGEELKLNYLYRWVARTDTFEQVSKSTRFVEDLNLHTGLTAEEIEQDRQEKARILEWMVNNNVMGLAEVGLIVAQYYRDREAILKVVEKSLQREAGAATEESKGKPAKKSPKPKRKSPKKPSKKPSKNSMDIAQEEEEEPADEEIPDDEEAEKIGKPSETAEDDSTSEDEGLPLETDDSKYAPRPQEPEETPDKVKS